MKPPLAPGALVYIRTKSKERGWSTAQHSKNARVVLRGTLSESPQVSIKRLGPPARGA